MIKIDDKKELMKLCSFITMGDGGVYKNGKNHYFIMNMIKENEDYVILCKDILENITSCKIKEVQKEGNRTFAARWQQATNELRKHKDIISNIPIAPKDPPDETKGTE